MKKLDGNLIPAGPVTLRRMQKENPEKKIAEPLENGFIPAGRVKKTPKDSKFLKNIVEHPAFTASQQLLGGALSTAGGDPGDLLNMILNLTQKGPESTQLPENYFGEHEPGEWNFNEFLRENYPFEGPLPGKQELSNLLGVPEPLEGQQFYRRMGEGIGHFLNPVGLGGLATRAAARGGSFIRNLARNALTGATGGATGHATEKLTGSPLAGGVVEGLVGAGGSILNQRNLEVGPRNRDLINRATNLGAEEEKLAPLVAGKSSVTAAKNLGHKQSQANILEETHESLSKTFEPLRDKASKLPNLSGPLQTRLIDGLKATRDQLNNSRALGPEGRKAIKEINDIIRRFERGNINPGELVDTYRTLNKIIKWNDFGAPGQKAYRTLKFHIERSLRGASREVGKDFRAINKLYTRWNELQKILGNSTQTQVWQFEKSAPVLAAALHKPGLLSTIFGVDLAKRGFTNYFLGPKASGIMHKMQHYIQEQAWTEVSKLDQQLKREIEFQLAREEKIRKTHEQNELKKQIAKKNR